MFDYRIRFHKGTPADSEVILEIPVRAKSDIPACMYRNFIEDGLKDRFDFDFTICVRDGYQVD